MKSTIAYISAFILLAQFNTFSQGTGYMRLEGNKFKDGYGNDFYPKVCTYSYHIVYNDSAPDDYYLSASNSYDAGNPCSNCPSLPNYEYEYDNQPACSLQIRDHMLKIVDMGFNAIRTHDIAPRKQDPNLYGVLGFQLTAFENKHPNWNNGTKMINIVPPYDPALNPDVELLFSYWELLIDIADQCGLKVLLDLAYGEIVAPKSSSDDYGKYLSYVAERFKNNTALMGYVVIEEPKEINNFNVVYTKKDICEVTSHWYDVIKTIDPNHLITAGGNSVAQDLIQWDPAVMKIDFFCPHPYPDVFPHEGMDYDKAINRVQGQLIWLHNNCPKPWMPGETGFSAIIDYNHNPPYNERLPDGTLQQQADYAQFIQDALLTYGSSGISWWNFQENWWGLYQDGFGLLDHSYTEKPVVDKFRNYQREFLPPLGNYYNPMNFPSSSFTYTGTVINEATGLAIKDALVYGWFTYYKLNSLNNYELKWGGSYTYTNDSGDYILHTLHPEAIIDQTHPIDVTNIDITAIGSERERHGWGAHPMHASPINASLKTPPLLDNIVSNETVNSFNSVQTFHGYRTLTASNVTIEDDGISILKAGKEVNISSDFNAVYGSDVHIFCEQPEFSDCVVDFPSGFERKSSYVSTNVEIDKSKEIEIKFKASKLFNQFEIIPNPGLGIFEVKINDNFHSSWILDVKDIYGKTLFNDKLNGLITELSLSFLAKGIYIISITQNNITYSKKLIIQ